jgi:magnesium transporter
MLTYYWKTGDKIERSRSTDDFENMDINSLIWVDLNFANEIEQEIVEKRLEITLQSSDEVEEIEYSSRYFQTRTGLRINLGFINLSEGHCNQETVSLIMTNGIFISIRKADLNAFADLVRRFKGSPHTFSSGMDFLITLLESRVDLDADILENITRQITVLGRDLKIDSGIGSDVLLKLNAVQDTILQVRENVIEKQRIVSAMLRSNEFRSSHLPQLQILLKDIQSLVDYAMFAFGRLENIQNTVLGLINLDQNKIIKIFTVVTVMFMPPTLIASLYGMNFKFMPELQWDYGYLMALMMMFISSFSALWFFKRKGWL